MSLKFEYFGSHTGEDLVQAVDLLPQGARIVSWHGGRSMGIDMTEDAVEALEEVAPFASMRLEDGGMDLVARK